MHYFEPLESWGIKSRFSQHMLIGTAFFAWQAEMFRIESRPLLFASIVPLKIGSKEKTLQNQVKALGGRWNPEEKVWYVPYGCVVGTRLEKLIAVPTKEEPKAPK